TPLETIRQRTEEKLKVTLSRESLANFVANLRQFKLLEAAPSELPRRAKRRRLLGSLLYLRFKLFDPDTLLTRLVGAVRFCFTPSFVGCTAVTILWAVCLAVGNWDTLQQDLARLWRWDALLLLWVTMCAITTAHEFAHGLACKHFGGEVHELGFLLIYLQPALYRNVSDAWLLPEKSKRRWAGLAGPHCQSIRGALATLAWRLTEPDTRLNHRA